MVMDVQASQPGSLPVNNTTEGTLSSSPTSLTAVVDRETDAIQEPIGGHGVRLRLQGMNNVSYTKDAFDVLYDDLIIYNSSNNTLLFYNVGAHSLPFKTRHDVAGISVDRSFTLNFGDEPNVKALKGCKFGPSVYVAFTTSTNVYSFFAIKPQDGTITNKLPLDPNLELSFLTVEPTTGSFMFPNRRTATVSIFNRDGLEVRHLDLHRLLQSTYSAASHNVSPFGVYFSSKSTFFVVHGTGHTKDFRPNIISEIIGSMACKDVETVNEVLVSDLGQNERLNCSDGTSVVTFSGSNIMTLVGDDLMPGLRFKLVCARSFCPEIVRIRLDKSTGRLFLNDRGSLIAFRFATW